MQETPPLQEWGGCGCVHIHQQCKERNVIVYIHIVNVLGFKMVCANEYSIGRIIQYAHTIQ